MGRLLIRFLSMKSIIQLVMDAFDHLEVMADKINVKAVKARTDIFKKTDKYDETVVKVTRNFNSLLVATKDLFDEKMKTLNAKADALAAEEKKARTLARNWKKNMLGEIN